MKNLVKLLFCTTLILTACQAQLIENKSEDASENSTLTSSSKDNVTIEPEFMISSEGIGKAKLGMTLGELKQISDRETEFKLESPFMVDINAISVSKLGEVQYYILYLAGTTSHPDSITPTDKDSITHLMTKNPNYQTLAGVKVGTTIKQAEAIYGNAVLSYHTANESREYVTFSAHSADSKLKFRPNSIKNGFAGIYPETSAEYHQTEKYQDEAEIGSIEVVY